MLNIVSVQMHKKSGGKQIMARWRSGNSARDRRHVPSNGWKNWDTWQVHAVIGNDKKAYDYVKKNKKKLLAMKKNEKLAAIERNSTYGLNGISKTNVDYRALNDSIRDLE